MFDMSNDSSLFRTHEQLISFRAVLCGNIFVRPDQDGGAASGRPACSERWLPLYEVKMIHHFDHRWASASTALVQYDDFQTSARPRGHAHPDVMPLPRYWVDESPWSRSGSLIGLGAGLAHWVGATSLVSKNYAR